MTVLDKKALVDLYRGRAGHYNLTANLYYLIGFSRPVGKIKKIGEQEYKR